MIISILSLVLIVGLYVYLYLFYRHIETKHIKVDSAIKKINDRIDGIFVIDAPMENEASKIDSNEVDIGDADRIAKDVKLSVEGGDTQVPPGYVEKT